MRPRIFFVTLAVSDLPAAVRFYRDGLGWTTEGIIGTEFLDPVTGAGGAVAMFALEGGVALGLYERDNLLKDAALPAGPIGAPAVSLAIPADSPAEVDRMLAEAAAAGARVPAPAHLRPFGVYSGYFTDPDGHLWEIACNPELPVLLGLSGS
jgi:uncharacterized protein